MENPQQRPPGKRLLEAWISRGELAIELEVSVDTLARWETCKRGPALARVGRRVLYRHAAVLEWLESLEQGRING